MTQYFFPVETRQSSWARWLTIDSGHRGGPLRIDPTLPVATCRRAPLHWARLLARITRTARAPARAARARCAGSPSSPNHPRSAPFSPTSGNRRHQRPTPAIPSIRPGTDHPARGVASPLTARVPHLGATIPATRQFRCTCVPAHPRSRSRSRLTHRRRALPPSASPHTGSRPLPARPEHAAARLPLDRNCRFDFLSIDNFGYVYGLMGLPRTYGVEATWRF